VGETHRFPLGDTPWTVWREAVLRTTGFPASGLDRLTGPACAAAADAYLAGSATFADFRSVFDRTIEACSAELHRMACDPLLREAITWQNPAVVTLLDAIMTKDPVQPRIRKWRYREQQLCRFWQRYCAKTETIGFFGPVTWVALDPAAREVSAVPGPKLLDQRRVFLEPWALAAYGTRLAEDPALRRWLPPSPLPHFVLDARCLRRPGRDAVPLTPEEVAVLARSDGRRPAARIAADLALDPNLSVATPQDAYRIVEDLVERKLLRWDSNLPIAPHTEALLDDRIAAIGDDNLRRRAAEGLERLRAARAAVADAAGNPSALAGAMAALDAEFVDLTGRPPRHRQGQAYAGRGLCYEDTTRDLRVVVGTRVLDAIAPALAMIMQAARWLTVQLASAYENELRGLVRDGGAGGRIRLSELWYPAIELFWGRGARPVDGVLDRLAARWRVLFGLSSLPASTQRVSFTASELAGPFHELFPADSPGWSTARIHSPDLHICGESVDAINNGDFLVVLGELHIAHATLCDRVLNWPKPEPGRMLRTMVGEFGRPRLVPLLPINWSKDSGRVVLFEPAPSDWNIGFARTAGVERERLIPAEAVVVELVGSQLLADLPNGERVPAIELFAAFLSMVAVDAFKDVSAEPHTPRVSIDRLVVFRETWRMTVGDLAELTVPGNEPEQYVGGRRLVAARDLAERCFARIGSETKPMYVDFTSPAYLASFAASVRSAEQAHGGDIAVKFSEMLPTPDQTWVPDREGRTYFGELRLQVTDPAYALTVNRDAVEDADPQARPDAAVSARP
jgi:lantibiotic biosynthesis dehydratase-like protein